VRTSLFVAVAANGVIGRTGSLPWHLPADLRRFRQLTTGHVVVVGRRTQESIVDRLGHALPGRISVVVTSGSHTADGPVLPQPSVPAALSVARAIEEFAGRDEVFVIGGAGVYAAALSEVDHVYLTQVHADVPGDVTMPPGWLDAFTLIDSTEPATDAEFRYSYQQYERREPTAE
jgi:dihydrofolate reductase